MTSLLVSIALMSLPQSFTDAQLNAATLDELIAAGDTYRSVGDATRALILYRAATDRFQLEVRYKAQFWLHYASVAYAQGQYVESQDALRLSLAAEAHQAQLTPLEVIRANELLGDLHYQDDHFRWALDAYDRSMAALLAMEILDPEPVEPTLTSEGLDAGTPEDADIAEDDEAERRGDVISSQRQLEWQRRLERKSDISLLMINRLRSENRLRTMDRPYYDRDRAIFDIDNRDAFF